MFPLQAIVNNAAVNIRVHVSFSMLVSSGYMPSSELAVSYGASQVALVVKNPPANAGDIRHTGSIPGSGRPLEKGMATYSSILA